MFIVESSINEDTKKNPTNSDSKYSNEKICLTVSNQHEKHVPNIGNSNMLFKERDLIEHSSSNVLDLSVAPIKDVSRPSSTDMPNPFTIIKQHKQWPLNMRSNPADEGVLAQLVATADKHLSSAPVSLSTTMTRDTSMASHVTKSMLEDAHSNTSGGMSEMDDVRSSSSRELSQSMDTPMTINTLETTSCVKNRKETLPSMGVRQQIDSNTSVGTVIDTIIDFNVKSPYHDNICDRDQLSNNILNKLRHQDGLSKEDNRNTTDVTENISDLPTNANALIMPTQVKKERDDTFEIEQPSSEIWSNSHTQQVVHEGLLPMNCENENLSDTAIYSDRPRDAERKRKKGEELEKEIAERREWEKVIMAQRDEYARFKLQQVRSYSRNTRVSESTSKVDVSTPNENTPSKNGDVIVIADEDENSRRITYNKRNMYHARHNYPPLPHRVPAMYGTSPENNHVLHPTPYDRRQHPVNINIRNTSINNLRVSPHRCFPEVPGYPSPHHVRPLSQQQTTIKIPPPAHQHKAPPDILFPEPRLRKVPPTNITIETHYDCPEVSQNVYYQGCPPYPGVGVGCEEPRPTLPGASAVHGQNVRTVAAGQGSRDMPPLILVDSTGKSVESRIRNPLQNTTLAIPRNTHPPLMASGCAHGTYQSPPATAQHTDPHTCTHCGCNSSNSSQSPSHNHLKTVSPQTFNNCRPLVSQPRPLYPSALHVPGGLQRPAMTMHPGMPPPYMTNHNGLRSARGPYQHSPSNLDMSKYLHLHNKQS